jgi:hypothetical protein
LCLTGATCFGLILYSMFGKSLCTYERCWNWCPWAPVQAWTHLILFGNTFCRSAFRKSLCTYKRCWNWCPWASVWAWTHLILCENTFCRSALRKSLCTYKRCWKWSPRVSVKVRTHLILFANTFCRSAFEMFLMYTVIAVFNFEPVSCNFWISLRTALWWSTGISGNFSANCSCTKSVYLLPSQKTYATRKIRSSIWRTIVSKNWFKQLLTLPVLHFNRCLTSEYSETTAHFNGNFDTDNQMYVP